MIQQTIRGSFDVNENNLLLMSRLYEFGSKFLNPATQCTDS